MNDTCHKDGQPWRLKYVHRLSLWMVFKPKYSCVGKHSMESLKVISNFFDYSKLHKKTTMIVSFSWFLIWKVKIIHFIYMAFTKSLQTKWTKSINNSWINEINQPIFWWARLSSRGTVRAHKGRVQDLAYRPPKFLMPCQFWKNVEIISKQKQ